jgi:2-keto-4-pentenoate hydratase
MMNVFMWSMESRKRFTALFTAVCLLTFLAPAALAAEDWEREADRFLSAMESGEAFPILEDVPPEERTAENAYKVQKILFEKLLRKGESIAGFKGALTAPAQMQRFGADRPASAPLLKSGLIEADPAKPAELRPFKGMMLEVELAFKTALPVTAPVKDEEELRKLIAGVHPSIEVPQVYFADMNKVGFFDIVAAGIGSRLFLVGPSFPADEVGLEQIAVKLDRDGTVVNEGVSSDALGGQWKALLWLVNDTIAQGYAIEAGQYLMTGALGKMIPAQAGTYRADYSFATLTFKVLE